MSLTRELDRADSPVNQFFSTYLDAERTTMFLKRVRKQQRSWPLRAEPTPDASRQAVVIGTAFDYLVRSVTWGLTLEDTTAAMAVIRETGFQWVDVSDGGILLDTRTGEHYDLRDLAKLESTDPRFGRRRWLLERWKEILERWPTASGSHADPQPIALMVLVAWIEGIFRTGQWATALVEGWQKGRNLEDLIADVSPAVIEDLSNLLERYRTSQLPVWVERSVQANPSFRGSRDVGGADADWIVDQTLWDMKTTKNPAPSLASDVKQILGYALLDYDDRYHIERVGLYYPRFSETLAWSVTELLADLSGVSQTLSEWRQKWQDMISLA